MSGQVVCWSVVVGNLEHFVLFCLHALHFSPSNFTIRDILGRRWRYVAFAWAKGEDIHLRDCSSHEKWRLFGVSVFFGVFGEQIYPAVPATLLARPDFFIPFVF